MTDTPNALRATSDALLRDLEVLGAIEDEKRSIPAGDPRLVELAGRIEEVARRLLGHSHEQRQLSESALAAADSGITDGDTAIEDVARPMAAILADWREAERRAAMAEPDTAEALEATALVDALRREYRTAFEAAQAEKRSSGD